MNEIWKVVIPSLITALTAIVGGYWGYKKWKRERLEASSKEFVAERRAAHKTIWDNMEDIHVGIRTAHWTPAELAKRLQALNAQILRLAPYLDSQIHRQVNEYADALIALARLINETNEKDASVSFSDTRASIPHNGSDEIRDQEGKVQHLRSALIEKVGAVLRGETPAAGST